MDLSWPSRIANPWQSGMRLSAGALLGVVPVLPPPDRRARRSGALAWWRRSMVRHRPRPRRAGGPLARPARLQIRVAVQVIEQLQQALYGALDRRSRSGRHVGKEPSPARGAGSSSHPFAIGAARRRGGHQLDAGQQTRARRSSATAPIGHAPLSADQCLAGPLEALEREFRRLRSHPRRARSRRRAGTA